MNLLVDAPGWKTECVEQLCARIEQLIEWEGFSGPVVVSLGTAGRKSAVALTLAEADVRRDLVSRFPKGSRLDWKPSKARLECTIADEHVTIAVAPLPAP